ncbi:MAG: hypothetical protein H5T97_04960, partial [Firmicutes bacterium]|nr:hypothetical protein [Bacillota bacterium]
MRPARAGRFLLWEVNGVALLVERLPLPPDPVALFAALGGPGQPCGALLESALARGKLGRYSFVLLDPFLVLRARGRRVTLLGAEGTVHLDG